MTDLLEPPGSQTDQGSPGGEQDAASSSPEAQDETTQLSIGIDIGSASTQVVFSRVHLRRPADGSTGRSVAVGHDPVYRSPVTFTPYLGEARIDAQAIGRLVDEAHTVADVNPDAVDTGAVILTGDACLRENADALADVLGATGARCLWVPAGHRMEAALAAYGSGAADASRTCGAPVLNIDLGGRTVGFALIDGGEIVHTATMDLGARLAVLDGEARLTRLDPAGERLAALAGCTWSVGKTVREHDVERVTAWMADAVVAVLTQNPAPPPIHGLWLTDPLPVPPRGTRGVMFSGGVSEYVYGREERDCGDLGRRFGRAIRQRLVAGRFPFPQLPVGEGIRATALGALEHIPRLSGGTVFLSRPDALLPRRHLPVLQPPMALADTIEPAAVATAIQSYFERFDLVEGGADVALAFRWSGAPSHSRLAAFARGVVEALPRTVEAGGSVFLMFDADVGHTVGAILKEEIGVGADVLVLDGLALWDYDYVDLGPVGPSSTAVPVNITSLAFKRDPRADAHVRGAAPE